MLHKFNSKYYFYDSKITLKEFCYILYFSRQGHRFLFCQNYMMFWLVLYPPSPYFEAVYCFICGRRRVAVARHRMICLVLSKDTDIIYRYKCNLTYSISNL